MYSPARYAVALLSGTYAGLYYLALLPGSLCALIGALAAVAAVDRRVRLPAMALSVASAAALVCAARVADRLDPPQTGVDLSGVFRVIDFPQRSSERITLLVEPLPPSRLPRRLRLTWYDARAEPNLGDCWQLTVRLRAPRGFSNPGGFDYESWLFRQGIGATGYVKRTSGRADCAPRPISRLRVGAAQRIASLLPNDQPAAVLMAITLGARDGISASQWERFAITGTSHLMAISGMHIGLAAGAGAALCWALSALLRRRANHRTFAIGCASLVALAYAVMSGFAVPARRACVMTIVVCFAWCGRRKTGPWQVLVLAMTAVLVASPLDALSPGFGLSFGAVALLIWQARRLRRAGGSERRLSVGAIGALIAVQFALLFGLLPLTAALFGRIAWLAPAINLIVLPVFNLVTIPFALAGLVLAGPAAPVGDGLLWLAWHSLRIVLSIVDAAASLPWAEMYVASLHPFLAFAGIAAAASSLTPIGWPGRRLMWIGLLTVVCGLHRPVPEDCVDLHVLDVGQGFAAVVDVGVRTAVFDTGPAFRSGSDTGDLVLVPFLRALGKDRVDVLVVSHADLDHAGGVMSLLAALPVRDVLAGGRGLVLPRRILPCVAGQFWRWGGITFSMLHPGSDSPRQENDGSCVLRIETGSASILLTGDIELAGERRLLAASVLTPATVVAVPHHGSKTSSHPAFVSRVSASLAIVSSGFGNRWEFPHQEVLDRWTDSGARVLNTAHSGAISVRVCGDGVRDVREQRTARRRAWRG